MDWDDRRLGGEARALAHRWWAIALRGVLAVIFGAITFAMPGVTLTTLLLLFGAYALVEGIFNIVAAATGRAGSQPWWALLLAGLGSVGAGLVTLFMPGLTALVLLYIIAGWAIVTGVLQIAAAVRLRKEIRDEWWLGLGGAVSVIFGVLIALAPGAGALAMVLWIGAWAVLYGATLVAVGFRLRGWRSRVRDERVRRAA